MPVLAGDSQAAWDREVLDDPRVTQLWDASQLVGSWLQAHGGAFWDTFLVYDPHTRWDTEPKDRRVQKSARGVLPPAVG
jgi:hypothetical protein